MSHEQHTRNVPASACNLSIGEVELGDNGDDAKTAPFRMVARSGKPIDHPYWGRIVHDLSGMRTERGKVAIDYCHDSKEVIGFANKFSTDSGDLEASGAIIPTDRVGDRATQVINQAKLGVPWEASINFGGSGIVLEEVQPEQEVSVNGYGFVGPGVVVREWPLRGIAVCPYGADQYTSTEFSEEDALVKVETMKSNYFEQSQGETAIVEEEVVEVDTAVEAEAEEAVEVEAEIDTEEAEETPVVEAAVESELTTRAEQGRQFVDAFGATKGAEYFTLGLSFEDAQATFSKYQSDRISDLEKRLAAKQEGEAEPVEFSERTTPKKKESAIRIAD